MKHSRYVRGHDREGFWEGISQYVLYSRFCLTYSRNLAQINLPIEMTLSVATSLMSVAPETLLITYLRRLIYFEAYSEGGFVEVLM